MRLEFFVVDKFISFHDVINTPALREFDSKLYLNEDPHR